MDRVDSSLAALVCLLACAVVAVPAVRAEEVPLYTNADLERYPALPDSAVEARVPSSDEWRFVTDYLDRGYARLEADRNYALERERAEAEVDLIRSRADRRTFGLPYYWNRFDRWGGCSGRLDGRRPTPRIEPSHLAGGPIRPLHAGPTRAQIDHFKASRRSGADAFPSASRARSGGGRER